MARKLLKACAAVLPLCFVSTIPGEQQALYSHSQGKDKTPLLQLAAQLGISASKRIVAQPWYQVDYHQMGFMEGCLGNATPTNSSHQLHWWKSPRWTVIRIEALAVVAIIISFFLATFGSCRRWSNSWIVQKGFFIAQVLSLSLGTYSIGLMQSSSVKSEMYPIWTVSLFVLFGCIDPVTTYNGLDYKGPLSKVVYGICLNCGYVLVISISTISSVIGNAAIITLSAITFVKGFHRSFALVQQNKIRDMVNTLRDSVGETCVIKKDEPASAGDMRHEIIVDLDTKVSMGDIEQTVRNNKDKQLQSCYDVCVALCLSHKLQRHILGFDYRVSLPETLNDIDFKWALKVIEIELAFVYDAFFTGNPFLHYYQAKTASLWALTSFAGICFLLVATAIPGALARRSGASGGCTKVVGTTAADLAITFGILVSLALLQLMQLVCFWTSNWARAAVACSFALEESEKNEWKFLRRSWRHLEPSGWMRLKVLVATGTNLFDKYLWQDKISQYQMLPEPRLLDGREKKVEWMKVTGETETKTEGVPMGRGRVPWFQTLGLHYIVQVIGELLSTNKIGGVKLDEDVKGSVIDFLGQIQSNRLDRNWLSSLPEEPKIRHYLPQFTAPQLLRPEDHCYRYMSCVMTWHIATWYCELAEQNKRQEEDVLMSKQAEAPICCGRETAASYYLGKAAAAIRRTGNYFQKQRTGGGTKTRDDRRVANALSQYCAYLVKYAPELLPGPVVWTNIVYDRFVLESKQIRIDACHNDIVFANMSDRIFCTDWYAKDIEDVNIRKYRTHNCQALARLLLMRRPDEMWKTLALVWVQLLVYAAPYGNVEAHMKRLSQGGEFITHLWALLYHLDIREWKVPESNNVHKISTIEDAKRILDDDDHDLDVVAFFASPDVLQEYRDKFVTASRLIDVKFYLTSSTDVAQALNFPESRLEWLEEGKTIMLVRNKANKKIISSGPKLVQSFINPRDIAVFVYETKLAWAQERTQEAGPSTSHNPIPIKKQSTEEGQTVAEIEEEI